MHIFAEQSKKVKRRSLIIENIPSNKP